MNASPVESATGVARELALRRRLHRVGAMTCLL